MTINGELVMGKEEVLVYFKVLPQHVPPKTEEKHENTRLPFRESNQGSPECEVGVLTTEPRHSVKVLRILAKDQDS
jgi:hypothetical protein